MKDMSGREFLLHTTGELVFLSVAKLFSGCTFNLKIDSIVFLYRYNANKAAVDSHIDDVCKLLRSTGASSSNPGRRPNNYPCSYFARVKVNEDLVKMAIGRLRYVIMKYNSPHCVL